MEVIETLSDSIAIEILNGNNILTGIGNELFLHTTFPANETEPKIRLNLKLTNKIHGIRKGDGCNKNILLVHGEKEFMLLTYDGDRENSARLSFRPAFYRAHLSDWISCGAFIADGPQFVLCTAHSIILRFVYNADEGSCDLIQRVSCEDKSTLYCASLFGAKWSELVVFAGNAFGELLVWQPSKADTGSKCVALIHRVSAHNGVIFSIDYDSRSQYLITTSDDRAVKWWKVNFSEDLISWQTSCLVAVASGFGHVARVFRGRIIREGLNTYALSVGEDSHFCLWRSNGELLFKRRQQYGATIWNFAYEAQNKTIYTIGSIGNLIAYGLKHILQTSHSNQEAVLLPQVSEENPTEYIAKVKFLTPRPDQETLVIGITNANRLLWYKSPIISSNNEDLCKWNDSEIDIPFKCTTIEVCLNRVAICGFRRMLLVALNSEKCIFETLLDLEVLQGIIRTFVFFTADKYLVCDDKGTCLLYSSYWKQRSLQLPNCKEPWLTTALLLDQDKYVVVSNRQGNLLLYQIANDGTYYELADTIKHPHGNLGSTTLQLVTNKDGQALLRSSGHDGAINLFKVDLMHSSIKRCCREIIPVSWVENIVTHGNDETLYLGFNDNHFVVWCREYDFLVQLSCGGGHRCWHFEINFKRNEISLIFVKNKRIRCYNLPLLNRKQLSLTPAKRWHIASCNKLVILEGSIAVSAADDNLIKIHTLTDVGLIQRRELYQHISNVRALKVVALNSNEFLIYSGGGRAQLCITKVNKQNFHVEELINYTIGKTDNNYQRNSEYKFDPETRIMSLDVRKQKKDVYDIFIGCSDGTIRVLSFNLYALEIHETKHYIYNRCVLQIEFIPEYEFVLAAATDGEIRLFDLTMERCLHILQHHSSGINALSTFYDRSKNTLSILSGGDDQAVAFTELCLKTFREIKGFRKAFLHTAQVCAAAISSCGLYGYTSGVDQNVYKLRLSDGTGDVLKCFHSCVADIKGLALAYNCNKCLIYGCGLQIILI